ncbi:alpha/beta fold hydrolase [Rodentibacter trehalosifermentans]|uniref:Alpha/beta hydrolase n=1 Tax=Rodentibacter trehalosifermentans TaxID=1908263 RepID=A0A1V3IPU8_9PAST|nr:alpha/beta fold hydrolase [Rodentibacter trehalosifermentans]OOF44257.1 alpha/beta hydrolase [Rodentibacter trehalosifermentans]OOF49244.1 alpha/beta hydrolase [Rodentibacter trehalosifermentans]OOF53535.1 alpha/beta hydrolase [Rodentibacter trehalosifermentans]
MPNSQLLNYQFHQTKQTITSPTLVFIHGLFGDMNNLGVIARALSEHYSILRMDLRNHGQSFRTELMDYSLMAEDLFALIKHLKLEKVILIGHSMGGKTAMKLTALYPEMVEKLIVIDIAPLPYGNQGHQDVFQGLFAVKNAKPQTRQQAKPLLEQHIADPAVVQFMLKSFDPYSSEFFRFHLTTLFNQYPNLMDWQNVQVQTPTLFIRGGNSSYIKPENTTCILAQFPHATSFTINGCGHWVHAEKPAFVIRAIERFLNKN